MTTRTKAPVPELPKEMLEPAKQKVAANRDRDEAIARMWGGLPVVDAKAELYVVVAEEDSAAAVQGDPTECAFAQACRRMYQSQAVMFYTTVAYVDLPDEKGKRKVFRFCMPAGARRLIERFDRTGEAPPGGFRLIAPKPSITFEGKARKNQVQRKRRREALLQGIKLPTRPKAGTRTEPLTINGGKDGTLEGVRNGTGMVHFT